MARSSILLGLLPFVLLGACVQREHFALAPAQPTQRPSVDAGVITAIEPAPEASAPRDLGPAPIASPGPGWTVRGVIPYARIGHSAVIDTDRDRMLVFGGNANDVWALALSGEHADTWSQLAVQGPFPPPHRYTGTTGPASFADAAAYVPERRSMLVVINPTPSVSSPDPSTEVWELSLAGEPTWRFLAKLGPGADGLDIQSASAVYDAAGHRLLMLGGDPAHSALWSLDLEPDGEPTWTRLAGAPVLDEAVFYTGHALRIDSARNRLILIGGVPRQAPILALELDAAEPQWQELDAGNNATAGYGTAVVVDAQRDALVVVGGDQQPDTVATYFFASNSWRTATAARGFDGASVVVDELRDRLIVFGGSASSGAGLSNETWTLALETSAWERIGDAGQQDAPRVTDRTLVYDPQRDAVIAFGNYASAGTLLFPLSDGVAASWQELAVAGTPSVSFGAAAYDPIGRAVVSFGGYDFVESNELARLGSHGLAWESMLTDGASPDARSGHTMIYDEHARRMIVFGGARDTSYPPRTDHGDVWALALDGAPEWTLLAPQGVPPRAGYGGQAIYDPIERRMLLLKDGVMHVLSLEGEPWWSALATTGDGPGAFGAGALLYDAEGRRLIALDHDGPATEVYALGLDDLVWRRYCPATLRPSQPIDALENSSAVLVPDGVFVAFHNAAYRFDLATPFCD